MTVLVVILKAAIIAVSPWLEVGDLFGSGTISGTESGSQGSLLELTEDGKKPMTLLGGEVRTFLEDGDSINLRAWAGTDEENLVGFGECFGMILSPNTCGI